jgi:DNA-binding XRE family transcriptional regulator
MLRIRDGAIRRLRQIKSWSQEELAHKSGVSVRTVQRAEGGESPNPNNLACIAEALEIEPTELLDEATDAGGGTPPGPPKADQSSAPIPVELYHVSNGNELLRCVDGSLALHADARAVTDPSDAEAIGGILDALRDYLDIGSDMSFADQLRYGVDMTSEISALKDHGWWVFAGKKRHKLCSADFGSPIPWVTCVVIVARADDSIVERREDGEPAAFVHLPRQVTFR